MLNKAINDNLYSGWKATPEQQEKRKAEAQRRIDLAEKVGELLKERGIELSVYGCGCDGSPAVKIIIDGEVICDELDFNLGFADA